MVDFVLDEDDRGSNSSDNEQDELMDDADHMDIDADAEADPDADGDEDDDDGDDDNGDDEDGGDDEDEPSARRSSLPTADDTPIQQVNGGPTSNPNPALMRTSASPTTSSPAQLPRTRYEVRPEALTASLYDIVPTMAAPQMTSINAIAATPDMRYWFTGGSDGYIRKYDGAATVNGKTLLTVAQRHPFVDSVVKAGVLMSYWDNEEPIPKLGEDQTLSSVYSLAVNSQALWMLSGLESGAINLYSVRHDEGKRISTLPITSMSLSKHRSAVSVLTLAQDEKSVLSGSWDKNVFDWDLNTGQSKRSFEGSGGQISAIEIRPASSLPVPEESGEPVQVNGTFSSNNGKPLVNGVNGTNGHAEEEDAPGSPADSLFGDGDAGSLFGDPAGEEAPSGGHFGDEDDEFSKAIGAEIDRNVPVAEAPAPAPVEALETNGTADGDSQPSANAPAAPETQDAIATSDSTFLAASIDGPLRVWDRRQPNPVAKIPTRTGVPPWCMAACWSPDGNYIYAGRRNGTVEEYNLHKGLKTPERTFKFPQGSGAVSAVRAMPNGRHLICASHDILRLYDLKDTAASKHSTVPFLIVPGPPRAGVISALHIDPTCKYMLSAAGNRGWEGSSTEVLIGYEIGVTP